MVSLPERGDPTLDAMKAAVEARAAEEPRRTYLGASSLGDPCPRKVWYQFNGYPGEPRRYALIAAAEDGHRTEEIIAARLRLVPGIELWTEDENGEQYGFKDGQFAGHIDGVIRGLLQAPRTPHVWENKASNLKKFAEFQKAKATYGEKAALKNWDMLYWVQAQIYMRYFDITRHYLTVATPGGRDIDSCRTEHDPIAAEALVAKAHRLIVAKQPPERIGKADFYLCRWCQFHGTCHGGGAVNA